MDRPEFNLIDWIRSRVTDRDPVTLGIGDDAAALRVASDRELLFATDMLMEGVHFTFPPATPQLAGRKALAVNLSDIAAMAGRATAAFVSVALPVDRGFDFAKDVHAGLLELADEYDIVLAGGDTNSWRGPLVINVAVVGEPLGAGPVLRSGAKPGDWLFVTGSLGGSLAGRHLTFTPRLREVSRLVELVDLHAMLDISDGLAADLHHILKQSQVGAILDAESIPASSAATPQATADRSALDRALSDGEDFELLFAVSPADGQRLESLWPDETPVTRIGQITAEPGCWLRDLSGQLITLPPLGWTHVI
ncbi:MAG: thiamine-monophosphate kinase [Candidatus Saccharimonas sp.]|nr:thiamine-monophosphate kinase [Planctomycetaceae bacterium]